MTSSVTSHLQTLESFLLHARVVIPYRVVPDEFAAILYFLVDACGAAHIAPAPIFALKEKTVASLEIDRALASLRDQGLMTITPTVDLTPRGERLARDGNMVFRRRMHSLWRKAFPGKGRSGRLPDDLAAAALTAYRIRESLGGFNLETRGLILDHLTPCP